jgi:hypothetical protein
MFTSVGLNDAIIKSYVSMKPAEALRETVSILPVPSVTTLGALHLLSRWAFGTVRKNGLKDPAAQARAADILAAFVTGACRQPFSITIVFSFAFVSRWPRPCAVVGNRMTFHVSDGLVNVAAWREIYNNRLIGEDISGPALAWWEAFKVKVSAEGLISLKEIVCSPDVATGAECSAFYAQVLAQVSTRIEVTLTRSAHIENDTWPLRVGTIDEQEEPLWTAREIDKTCMIHVERSKLASKGQTCCGVTIDKVNARGLDIQNGFIVYPNNVAAEFVPQVGSRCCAVGSSIVGPSIYSKTYHGGGLGTAWVAQACWAM